MRFLLFLIALLSFIPKTHSQDAFKFDDIAFLGAAVPAASEGFAPSAGYFAWFSADDLSGADDSDQTTWANKGGHGGNATGHAQLKNGYLNGHKALYVDGGATYTGYIYGAPTSQVQPYTLFIVAKLENEAAMGTERCLIGCSNLTTVVYGLDLLAATSVVMHSGSSITASFRQGTNCLNWNVYSMVFTNGGSVLYTNGAVFLSGNTGVNALQGLRVGALAASTYKWKGYFTEVLAYTNLLSESDRQANESGLKTKYGL